MKLPGRPSMPLMARRSFMAQALVASAIPLLGAATPRGSRNLLFPKDPIKLSIERTNLDLGGGVTVPTTTYGGTVPGPLLRMRAGQEVRVRVYNRSGEDELVHWHGLHVSSRMDGAEEEGSPVLKAGTVGDYAFVPRPAGTHWYHTHMMAHTNLDRGGYSGQFGFLCVDDGSDPGDYDQEHFMAVHHWNGRFHQMGRPVGNMMVDYAHATFNGLLPVAAAPIRVRQGQRVMFRFLNASATQNTRIALPGHHFTVVALDGTAVPRPTSVRVLELGVAERIDAVVEMNNPGIWQLGSVDPVERSAGLMQVVEYASQCGTPTWREPERFDWTYRLFADAVAATPAPVDDIFPLVLSKDFTPPPHMNGMDLWRINGLSFPDTPTIKVREGGRYRFRLMNATREAHPVHFHRHSFEITAISGVPTSGLIKDTVMLPVYGSLDVDWTADNKGPSLFHCHQQVHMDAGLMQMVDYV
ncbi:multicopper oxidase family protein [Sphingobium aquiterrae]|uniref:multicopper oxidase family protein n=1 Tax=Sphingobium aquiterrae TaxID=2038656 RepID=UPI003018D608